MIDNSISLFTGIATRSKDSLSLSLLEVFCLSWRNLGLSITVIDNSDDVSIVDDFVKAHKLPVSVIQYRHDTHNGIEQFTWDHALKVAETEYAWLSHIDNFLVNSDVADEMINMMIQESCAIVGFMDVCPSGSKIVSLPRISPICVLVNVKRWREMNVSWDNQWMREKYGELIPWTKFYAGDVSCCTTAYLSYLQYHDNSIFRLVDSKTAGRGFKHFHAFGSSDIPDRGLFVSDGVPAWDHGGKSYIEHKTLEFSAFYKNVTGKELAKKDNFYGSF